MQTNQNVADWAQTVPVWSGPAIAPPSPELVAQVRRTAKRRTWIALGVALAGLMAFAGISTALNHQSVSTTLFGHSDTYTAAKTACYRTALTDIDTARTMPAALALAFATNAASASGYGYSYRDLYDGCYAGIGEAVN